MSLVLGPTIGTPEKSIAANTATFAPIKTGVAQARGRMRARA
jgi:hypothetical protein